MHTTESANSSNSVPGFLVKLWKLVGDPQCDDLIFWSENGTSFVLRNQARFSKELLPLYFKHNNMASFIRQLNMYGFRKVTNIEQGGMRSDHDEMEFFHPFFVKGEEILLQLIKRKGAGGKSGDIHMKQEVVSELLTDVKAIRGKQDNIDSILNTMKRENEILWRELTVLRQKHMEQQQVVQKLIHFLVTMVQSGRNISLKRKLPMLNDSGPQEKISCLTRTYPVNSNIDYSSSPVHIYSGSGPVIHDVTDSIDENSINEMPKEITSSYINMKTSESPLSAKVDEIPISALDSPLNITESIEPLPILEPLQPDISNLESHDVLMTPDVKLTEDTAPSFSTHTFSPISTIDSSAVTINIPDSADSTFNIILENTPSTAAKSDAKSPATSLSDALASTLGQNDKEQKCSDEKEGNKTVSSNDALQVSTSDANASVSNLFKNNFIEHLEDMELELDWLQDQFSRGGLNINSPSFAHSWSPKFFASEESSAENALENILFNENASEGKAPGNDIVGNELIQYGPLLEFETLANLPETSDKCTLNENPSMESKAGSSHNLTNSTESVSEPLLYGLESFLYPSDTEQETSSEARKKSPRGRKRKNVSLRLKKSKNSD